MIHLTTLLPAKGTCIISYISCHFQQTSRLRVTYENNDHYIPTAWIKKSDGPILHVSVRSFTNGLNGEGAIVWPFGGVSRRQDGNFTSQISQRVLLPPLLGRLDSKLL